MGERCGKTVLLHPYVKDWRPCDLEPGHDGECSDQVKRDHQVYLALQRAPESEVEA